MIGILLTFFKWIHKNPKLCSSACQPKNSVSPNLHKRCRHPPSYFRNCTGYRSIISSSSKSPSWHIELSGHPIHPISTTSFSAAMHLVFAHLPPFNYTNQFTNHPSSTEASRMPLLLEECLMPYPPPSSSSRDQPSLDLFKRHLKTHLFRTPTWSQWRHKAPLTLCKWRIINYYYYSKKKQIRQWQMKLYVTQGDTHYNWGCYQ